MFKMTIVFRVLHVAALGIAVVGFVAAMLRWFNAHRGVPAATDFLSLGALLFGAGLGSVLLWRAFQPMIVSSKTAITLYVAWIAIFAWYWFSRFAVSEFHTLDPERMEREQIQQTVVSTSIFLCWVGLYLIGPLLMTRRLRK